MGAVTVVFDTNVLVSALGFGGTPLDALLAGWTDHRPVASEQTLAELDRVMRYERLPFTHEDRQQYLRLLRREFELVAPTRDVDVIEADPDDDAFLACGLAADADFLVSGDDHLLDLGSYRGIEIVTPAEFLSRVR